MSLASWDLAEFGGGTTLLGERSREPGPQGSPVRVAPPWLGDGRGLGRAPRVTKKPVLPAFPGQGPGINTPPAEIKPVSKLCSLSPREVQGLGLEGRQPGSDQQPHSRCPRLLLPPSGLESHLLTWVWSREGEGTRQAGGCSWADGTLFPALVRPHGEVGAPKQAAAGAHGVQQRAVGGAQRSLPEERVPELPGPPAPGGQAPPGRAQSAGLSRPPRGHPSALPEPPLGTARPEGPGLPRVPQQARGLPAADPGLDPGSTVCCITAPAASGLPDAPHRPGCPGAQPSGPLTRGASRADPFLPRGCPSPAPALCAPSRCLLNPRSL